MPTERKFGSNIKSIMNLPNQKKVLLIRKKKEAAKHKKEKELKKLKKLKEKKEKELKKLQKDMDTLTKKFKGVNKLKKQATNKKEIKVYDDLIKELNIQFKHVFKQIQKTRGEIEKL